MAPKTPRVPKAPKVPRTPKAPAPPKAPAAPKTSTAQKPMATGDVTPFASHAFRADQGEGLPDQANTLNPNRAK